MGFLFPIVQVRWTALLLIPHTILNYWVQFLLLFLHVMRCRVSLLANSDYVI